MAFPVAWAVPLQAPIALPIADAPVPLVVPLATRGAARDAARVASCCAAGSCRTSGADVAATGANGALQRPARKCAANAARLTRSQAGARDTALHAARCRVLLTARRQARSFAEAAAQRALDGSTGSQEAEGRGTSERCGAAARGYTRRHAPRALGLAQAQGQVGYQLW